MCVCCFVCFFFQAEDGIRDLVRSRGLGDVYKRQGLVHDHAVARIVEAHAVWPRRAFGLLIEPAIVRTCLLYTSDAADERSSVDLGGRRIIKKKTRDSNRSDTTSEQRE